MKWEDKKELDIDRIEDVYTLLNTPAETFYKGAFFFIKHYDFANKLKSDLLCFLVEFTRVIETTFSSSIYLGDVDLPLFAKMFPNFSNNIFNIKTNKDLKKIGELLSIFRNVNAHSIPSKEDLRYLNNLRISTLKNQAVLNNNIAYVDRENKITLAGILFIIFNLGRTKSLDLITRKNDIFGLIIGGEIGNDSGERFVNEISHVNLEIKIREDNRETVFESIFGEWFYREGFFKLSNHYGYNVLSGNNYYKYRVSCDVFGSELFIQKGSLTSIYYENDYRLTIKDKTHFIQLANQFPPFILVDLLYKLNVTVFDETTYLLITEPKKWELYSKLMYPKFYIDKNIDILLSDKSNADLTIISNVCNGALLSIFLRLEKLIIKFFKISLSGMSYSKVSSLLKSINAPQHLIEKTQIIRNSFSHGYILGEYNVTPDDAYQYSLHYIVDYLIQLLEFFSEQDGQLYNALRKDISSLFISQIISVKTKLFTRETIKFMNDYPNISNYGELEKKRKFFDASTTRFVDFSKLNEIVYGKERYIEFYVDGLSFGLVFFIYKTSLDAFNRFVQRNNLSVDRTINDGIVKRIYLKPCVD